jgi:hypothetical protein
MYLLLPKGGDIMADNKRVTDIVTEEKIKENRKPSIQFTDLQEDLLLEMDEGPGKYPVRGF